MNFPRGRHHVSLCNLCQGGYYPEQQLVERGMGGTFEATAKVFRTWTVDVCF